MVLLEWLASKKRISLFSICLLLWFQEIISILTPRNVTENFEGKGDSKGCARMYSIGCPFQGKKPRGTLKIWVGVWGVGCGALPESLTLF